MKTKSRNTVTEFSCCFEAVASNVDTENFVIKHVKLIGPISRNGRVYPPEVLKKAAPLYEGATVYQGHPSDANQRRSSTYGEGMGLVRSPAFEGDSLYGDVHLNPEHPRSKQAIWDAKNSTKVGLSHHADLITTKRDGKVYVESIEAVHSVDIVNRPATTKNFFESENHVKTLKQLIEAQEAKSESRTILEDMMAGGAPADMPVDVADGSSSDSAIKAAFKAAIGAKFDDDSLDYKATLAAIKSILQAYDKLSSKPAEKADDEPKDEQKTESLEAKVARLERTEEARKLADKEGVKLEESDIAIVVALESADHRAAFVKRLPKVAAKEGKGGNVNRPGSSPGINTTTETESLDTANVPKPGNPADTISFLRSGR